MSTELQTQAKVSSATPSLISVQAGLLQRKCACGSSAGLDGECEECSSKRLTLQRYSINRADPFKLLHSLAEPSNPDLSATVEPSFGHNFSRVQVHNHVPERIQTKLNVNEPGDQYEQETDGIAEQVMMSVPPGREPTVPQLSSSPSMIQRALAGELAQTPETETTAETPAAGLIVDDVASVLGPGQMRKSEFLDEVQRAVCAAADAELASVGRSTEGCPYIEKWISHYRTRESQQVERTVRRYAPETVGVTTARDYIPLLSERVRRAVAVWAKTGEITGVPEGVSTEMPGAGIETGAEGTPSATGSVQLKGREGGTSNADNPQAILAQLGAGGALDTGLKSRMESAFGYDFSRVRVHTDSNAAELANRLNARAFTIGREIAFASGEYQPGTLIGDALLAHELAHVVQQGGGSSSVGPMQTGDANYNTLEGDADKSAVSVMVSLWGGAKGAAANSAQNAMPSLKSRLRLQRCGPGIVTSETLPEHFEFKIVVSPEEPGQGGWKVACFSPLFHALGWTLECNYEVGVPLENYLGPVSDSFAQGSAYLAGGAAGQVALGAFGPLPTPPPKATFCNTFQKAMDEALRKLVPGARVSKFGKYCKPESVGPFGGGRVPRLQVRLM